MRSPAIPGSRVLLTLCVLGLSACKPPPIPNPDDALIARGRALFFDETFDGNGRTCGSCHPASNNFAIDPAFIATLPDDDPLFVAEFTPALSENFENPTLMREFGLILENQDGFDDLENTFNMRGVPHTLGLPVSIDNPDGPRTGWSGDGAPGDGSLRSFATGAVIQHFTKTLGRVPGVDFRLPTDEELDAMEAFQLSLGRQQELTLPLPLKGLIAARGQEIFNDATLGKCFACHSNAGANGDPNVFGPDAGNLNFNTGAEDLPDQPADLTDELNPPDDGFGVPGNGEFNTPSLVEAADTGPFFHNNSVETIEGAVAFYNGEFNTPSLVEAADTGPFFHNNSVETIEGAVAFYNGDAFNDSPAGQLLTGATGSGINLDATQVVAVAAFLRVISALENIRESIEFLNSFADRRFLGNEEFEQLLARAIQEMDDSVQVLAGGGLHPTAVSHLREARRLSEEAIAGGSSSETRAREAIAELGKARGELVES